MTPSENRPSLKDRVDAALARWDAWTEEQLAAVVEDEAEGQRSGFLNVEPQSWWPERAWYFTHLVRWMIYGVVAQGIAVVLSHTVGDATWAIVGDFLEAMLNLCAILLALLPIWSEFVRFSGLGDLSRLSIPMLLLVVLVLGALLVLTVGHAASMTSMNGGAAEDPDLVPGTPPMLAPAVSLLSLATYELVYRGFFLGAFVSRWSPRTAILAMAAWYSVLTVPWTSLGQILTEPSKLENGPAGWFVALVYAFVNFLFGCILGRYQLRRGSLYGCMAIHAVLLTACPGALTYPSMWGISP